jgi:hypothetical protein
VRNPNRRDYGPLLKGMYAGTYSVLEVAFQDPQFYAAYYGPHLTLSVYKLLRARREYTHTKPLTHNLNLLKSSK